MYPTRLKQNNENIKIGLNQGLWRKTNILSYQNTFKYQLKINSSKNDKIFEIYHKIWCYRVAFMRKNFIWGEKFPLNCLEFAKETKGGSNF